MTGSPSDASGSSRDDRETLGEETTSDQSDVVSTMGDFYRGEVERTVSWRTRLDQTTNWAVVLMATILTFVFSSEDNPHYMLLVAVLGVFVFLLIESQRYQEYDAWRYRVRILQRHFVADVADPEHASRSDWRQQLGEDLRSPTIPISRLKATAHRLRRVYLFLLTILVAAWLLRISIFDADRPWLQTAAIADIPGLVVVGAVLGLYFVLFALALWSAVENRTREFGDGTVTEQI